MLDNFKLSQLNINTFITPSDIVEEKKIGSGGFGKVMSGSYKSLQCAIKILKEFDMEEFLKEIKILILFRHAYIPLLYGIVVKRDHKGYNPTNIKSVNLVNELVRGQTFDVYLKTSDPSEIEILTHLIDLATVLTYLHSFRLIHRDLKPSNVMIDKDMNVKLLDFGISRMTKNTQTITNTVGTILYMAPENFSFELTAKTGCDSKSSISTKVDVWAFGCMVSEIFSKHKPWAPAVRDDGIIMGLLFSKKEFYIPPSLKDEKLIKFIKECTKIDPDSRINMRTVRDRLIDILYDKISSSNLAEVLLNREAHQKAKILNKVKGALIEKRTKLYHNTTQDSNASNETMTNFSFNPMTYILDSTLEMEERRSIRSIDYVRNTKSVAKKANYNPKMKSSNDNSSSINFKKKQQATKAFQPLRGDSMDSVTKIF